ncbi:helix-turn-helix transcriptional regulator [Kribbella catacumbae]|uniref:helix-turn-helix transcriptional regulator n=1 Tax=Kribbella catacumbae TaxID=460086 RepID=UPI000376A9B3|nr:LuxR C-terminal-related transcriptional regulator [Kribbella catacumbae]
MARQRDTAGLGLPGDPQAGGRGSSERIGPAAAAWAAGVHPPNQMVGRDDERAALRQIVQGAAQLVTLTGPGGTGKTRLAQAVVGDVRAGFRDGAWPVELASLSEPSQITGAVAAACRAVFASSSQHPDNLHDGLRDRELLLVLDNCEQVADGVADLLTSLLSHCRGLRVLTTSRQPLQIYGERLYPVRPLPLVHSLRVPLAEIAAVPSIALFVQRARAVAPDFALTDDNVGDVAEICRLVDGLPLAIELAATKLRLFGPPALLARLRDGIDILRLELTDVPRRQQTMRAAILWGYQLLTKEERDLLIRLGVFAGGFNAAAVVAVVQLTQPRGDELLEALLDKGMLTSSVGADGEPRFDQLHTTRAFCVERLRSTDDEQEVRDRHAEYVLRLVAEAEQDLRGGRRAAHVRRLTSDQANARVAYQHLRARGDADAALALATGMWRFMFSQGHLCEGLQMLEETLADGSVRTDSKLGAEALHAAGMLAMAVGKYASAEGYQRRAVAAFHDLGEAVGEAAALNCLGNLARVRGDLPAARRLCEQSLAIWRAVEAPRAAALVLIDLATISMRRGDVSAVDEAISFALPLLEDDGDDWNARSARALAGLMAFRRGDQQKAEQICRTVASEAVETDTHQGTPFALEALALVLAGRRRPPTDQAAVRLIAAAGSIRAETHSYACAEILTYVDRALQHLRQRLGTVAFDNACIAGKTLPLPTLLDEDAGLVEQPAWTEAAARTERIDSDRTPADVFQGTSLTAREREVVVLVANGLTNRQIANRLNIAEWTATNHVRHVMRKLGMPSRVHVAQWVTQRYLAQ